MALDELNSRRYRAQRERVFMRDGRACQLCGTDEGEMHIDHIIPCSAFDLTDESQQRVAFHFTNLRPIWAEQNHRKHGKIPDGQRRLFWSHADVGKARRLLASTAQSRPETTCTKVQ
ncbi:MAG: hypothetical protein EBR82_47760 [Caulobacteraceae bacterium]|nr:hypothetical protein [Caulobacteraceae bacterium]